MKKFRLIVMAGIALSLCLAGTAWACGCTPGYWKQEQHFDSWIPTGFNTEDTVLAVFGCGPDITLLEALRNRGGGELALTRHAAAALLNASYDDNGDLLYSPAKGDPAIIINGYCSALQNGSWETQKDFFEYINELGCPLN